MCDEINSSCPPVTPPWEPPQVIPAQVRRVNNLIFRKINQFHRENEVEDVTPDARVDPELSVLATGTNPSTSGTSSGSSPSPAPL